MNCKHLGNDIQNKCYSKMGISALVSVLSFLVSVLVSVLFSVLVSVQATPRPSCGFAAAALRLGHGLSVPSIIHKTLALTQTILQI